MSTVPPDLATEREALERARRAGAAKLEHLLHEPRKQSGVVFAEYTDPYIQEGIDSMFDGAIEKLRKELVVFGRVDDDQPWRIGLYGVADDGGDQLVVDWRARFAERFYQASFDDPMELARRVTYVGCIDDLFVEDFVAGEVAGTSPLLAELSKSRGSTMRAAVATLQREQDLLVRIAPRERLVLRGGPGTGKTVVGLHRAAWLVYNDRRLTSDKILVIGPSDRYLSFVSAVLPTLGEATIKQTTFDTLLGPSTPAGSDERWLPLLDALEAPMLRPAPVTVGKKVIPEADVADAVGAVAGGNLPWRDRRERFLLALKRLLDLDPDRDVPRRDLAEASKHVWPPCNVKQAWAKVRSKRTLLSLGADRDLVDSWLAEEGDGALYDEVRYRFEGVPAKYSHVIVDEAQDLSLLQLRAVTRRSDGLTLVGDDAQRSNPHGIGLERVGEAVGAPVHVLDTAYRMSAEIAAWLNEWARDNGIDAVELVGIRHTGVPVTSSADLDSAVRRLSAAWPNVASIAAGEVWDHKGIEYDGVVVDARGMTPSEVYLAASRAAHELVLTGL